MSIISAKHARALMGTGARDLDRADALTYLSYLITAATKDGHEEVGFTDEHILWTYVVDNRESLCALGYTVIYRPPREITKYKVWGSTTRIKKIPGSITISW